MSVKKVSDVLSIISMVVYAMGARRSVSIDESVILRLKDSIVDICNNKQELDFIKLDYEESEVMCRVVFLIEGMFIAIKLEKGVSLAIDAEQYTKFCKQEGITPNPIYTPDVIITKTEMEVESEKPDVNTVITLVDVTGIPVERLVFAFYNASKYQGNSILGAVDNFTLEDCKKYIETCGEKVYVDYLHGKVIKIDFTPAPIDGLTIINTRLFDRDLGKGFGAYVVKKLKVELKEEGVCL